MACAGIASAQRPRYATTTPTQSDLYCSGVVSDKPVPSDIYVISGEDSRYKTTFDAGRLRSISIAAPNKG